MAIVYESLLRKKKEANKETDGQDICLPYYMFEEGTHGRLVLSNQVH